MPEPEFTATEEFLPAGPDDRERPVVRDEFSATGVRIERGLRSLTRAGQVRVGGGTVELLNSGGRVIATAPAKSVRILRVRFRRADRVLVDLGGTRYVLTLRDEDAELGVSGSPGERRPDGGETPAALFARAVRLAARPR
ncbi:MULTISPECIES: hypothetical protein [Streptomyces]|uniref:hypothetical protein n=1 Tax=Streptomyces TaxID=1883 RepID=UPI001407D7D7|nr:MULTISPECIES: hypothetical protein [Streptomyces]MDH6228385.1 hypothetical protein [Streptomyces sp. MJP52]